MKILLTGCAGFVGWKTAQKLLEEGNDVVGVDNLNDYYDVSVKEWRLSSLQRFKNFTFYRLDIENKEALSDVFSQHKFDAVINEAARAGVRYSLQDPWVYLKTNAEGTLNLLELMKDRGVEKFVLASTSSLYAGQSMPFKEELPVNTPISPYAASKKAAEVMAYSYHYLYGIDVSVLRYFTVYGPAGRPDMSIFRFVKWIMEGSPIELFGDGSQSRDFTYIDDIAEGTVKALKKVGYEVINLGSDSPHELMEAIKLIERFTGRGAEIEFRDFHKADMKATWADIGKARRLLDWSPKVPLEEGIEKTVRWFKDNWEWLREVRL